MNAPDDSTSSTTWTVSYLGEHVANNTMDALSVAEALQAMHQLFLRSNTIVNGTTVIASLHIRATTPGSFDIELLLGLAAAGGNFLSTDLIKSASDLKLLLTGGTSDLGVLGAFKSLRGRPHNVTEQNSEGIIIEAKESRTENTETRESRIKIPPDAYEVLKDPMIHKALHGVVKPLFTHNIERVTFNENTNESVSIASGEIDSIDDNDFEDAADNTIEIPRQVLTIVAPVLNDSNLKWRLSDGLHTNWYSILDDDFLKRVAGGNERFGTGDILVCTVKIEQRVLGERRVRNDYYVTRVIAHELPSAQPKLL